MGLNIRDVNWDQIHSAKGTIEGTHVRCCEGRRRSPLQRREVRDPSRGLGGGSHVDGSHLALPGCFFPSTKKDGALLAGGPLVASTGAMTAGAVGGPTFPGHGSATGNQSE